MVFEHVTWSGLKNLVQKRSVKNSTKVFSLWKYVHAKTVCRLTSCVRVSWKFCSHIWTSGNIDTSRQTMSPQHLFPEPNSVVINHVVLHSDNQSTWLQTRKGDFLRRPAAFALLHTKRTDISTVGYTARIGVLAEVPIVWFDSRWRHWDFFDFILPAAIRPWSGLSLLKKWVISWVKKTAGE